MAGDWIKIESVTPEKPEVFEIADHLGITPEHAFGCLVIVWIWADQQSINGNAPIVTKSLIDRKTGVSSFTDAMIKSGWLIENDNGYTFKNFEKHNGNSAKNRAMTARRVAKHKGLTEKKRSGNDDNVTNALPREEKRREENIIESTIVDSSSEPSQAPSLTAIISIPTNRNATKGEEYPVTQQQVDDWSASYPAVDVMQQLRTMRSWSINNPTKRKTVKGMPKFIDSWLSREQDRGGKNETHQRTDQHETHHQRITRLIHAGC